MQRIYPWDTLESIEATRFHDKTEMVQREAFSHLDKLIPSRENAFLLRDRSFEERAVVEGYHIKADTPDGK